MQEKKEFDKERGDSRVVLRMELLFRRHKRPAYAEIRVVIQEPGMRD
jgi:hypothetical protein